MSNEGIVSSVLEDLAKIKKFIHNSDIETCLKKKETDKATILKKSKEFVDELFELSKNIRDNLHEHYNKLPIEDSSDDTSVPSNVLTNGLDTNTNTSLDNENSGDNLDDSTSIDKNLANADSKKDDEHMETSSQDEIYLNETLKIPEDNEKEPPKEDESDPLTDVAKEPENETISTETVTNSDDTLDPPKENNEIKKENSEEPPRKSLIRLVDLSKLIDPDKHKSVKFDTSVIVLSSSDEETNVKVNDENPKVQTITATKNTQKVSENKVKNSKDNSKEKKVRFEIEKVSDSDDSDSDKNCRKSRRLRNNQKEKIKRENNFKTLFKRTQNKKIDVGSNSSSDSEAEQSKTNMKGRLKRQCKDDTKITSKVYVPLPYFECDKLKEVYNTNKECFDILSAVGLESVRRSKRSRTAAENESSSDAEKTQKKKSKTKNASDSSEENSTNKNPKSKRKGNDKNSNKEADSEEEKSNKKTLRTVRKSAKNKGNSEDEESPDEKAKKNNSKDKKRAVKSDSDEEKSVKSNDKNKSVKGTTKEESNKEETSKESDESSDSQDEEKSKKRKLKVKESVTENLEDNSDSGKSTNKKPRTKKKISTKEDSDEESDIEKSKKRSTRKNANENKLDVDKGKSSITDGTDSEDDKTDSQNKKNKQDLSSDEDTTAKNSKNNDKKKKSNDEKRKSNENKTKKSAKNEKSSEESNDEVEINDAKTNKSSDNSSKKNNTESESEDTSTTKKKNKNTNANKNNTDSDEEKASKKKVSSDESGQENENDKNESKTDVSSDVEDQPKKKNWKESDSDDGNTSEKEVDDKRKSTSSSDSEEFSTFAKKREKAKKEIASKAKKKVKKIVVSDSDESESEKKKEKDSDSKSSEDSSDSDASKKSSEEEKQKKSAPRRRIKKTKDSSDDSDEEVSTRKKIREVLGKSSLSESTKQAEAEEKERKARIAEKQKKYNRIFEEKKDATIDKVVLDYDEKTKEPILEVNKKIVKNLKPHQASGIQFMFDACFESLERMKKSEGSGCILAHCMGLGKTLQVISLVHTLLNNSKTKVEKVLVVCPINTVLNWKSEFKKWIPSNSKVEVYELATAKKNYDREYTVKCWHEDGGVLIIGYNMFRLLSNPNNRKITKRMRTTFQEGMVDPGPDLVVCDEGHLLKNEKTNLSIAMNRIKTMRRIVLTGTPLQNNLKEYWCMVQFIKPNLLGTYKEYMNRFVNPITNGQYTDSTQHDIVLMRKRSHVLHKLLDGVVQRRDYSVLEPYLPPKHEYVIFVKLSEVQTKIYKTYMEKYARKNVDGSNRTSFLFTDFQQLQRICTHPRVLLDKTVEKKEKWDEEEEESEGSLKDFIDDRTSSTTSTSSSSSGSEDESDGDSKKKKPAKARMTRARTAQKNENNEDDSEPEVIEVVAKEWWQEFCDGEELDNIKNSGKLSLLFEILKECEEIGDKILVFSQSLYALNCIEYFLHKIDDATQEGTNEKIGGYKGNWSLGLDYFRIDGSSSCDNRAFWCDSFNNPDNVRARLFLISTKAGGLGINLVAANRVIIFDVSWNPSHDIQSIYRVYRFGQIKPSYIYRFVTYGAMEMKIYERQVTKQAISKRVIDEQQIDRHYNQNDLQELYKCDLEPTDRPVPLVPKDVLLGEMLQKYENIIYKYHLHQSLLENKEDEGLNEEERKAAWEEFENEKVFKKTYATAANPFFVAPTAQAGWPNMQGMSARTINAALMNIVRRDNPTWAEHQIKGIIPALVRQLQVQIEENDMSMYQRVVQEIQIMNQAKMKESLYQQQMMQLYQQQYLFQKQQQAVLGNLKITPQTLQNIYGTPANYYAGNMPYMNGPSTSSTPRPSNDVIELND